MYLSFDPSAETHNAPPGTPPPGSVPGTDPTVED